MVHWKWFVTMVAMVGSAGLLWLLLYWIPQWKLWWTHEQVCLDEADTVLIEDEYKKDYKRYSNRFPVKVTFIPRYYNENIVTLEGCGGRILILPH